MVMARPVRIPQGRWSRARSNTQPLMAALLAVDAPGRRCAASVYASTDTAYASIAARMARSYASASGAKYGTPSIPAGTKPARWKSTYRLDFSVYDAPMRASSSALAARMEQPSTHR